MTINYHELDPANLDFVAVADEEEVPNGERIFLEIDDHNIVLFNIAGKHFAIRDVCSHDDGPVGEGKFFPDEEHQIVCPRHGARFDVRDGSAVTLPAIENIPAYPVRLKDGKIEIGLPPVE